LALSWRAQVAINFVVGCAVLVAGLIVLGRDGKMLTYAALVLGCATCQWVLVRGWRGCAPMRCGCRAALARHLTAH
jgi:hypothetical protein